MKKNGSAAAYITLSAVIAALYAALTYAASFVGLAYGNIQFRFSEALTVLALFTPAAVPGLTVGCFLGNLGSPYGLLDVVLGTAATALAAFFTYKTRKITLRGVPVLFAVFPTVFNAVFIGAEITWFLPEGASLAGFALSAAEVGVGELAVTALLGFPLWLLLKKGGVAKRVFKNTSAPTSKEKTK